MDRRLGPGRAGDRERVERRQRRRLPGRCARLDAPLGAAADVLEGPDPARAEALRAEQRRDLVRGLAVLAQDDQPRARRKVAAQQALRPGVQADRLDLERRPAEAGADQADRRRRRQDAHLGRREATREQLADAEAHRVAAREDHDALAAPGREILQRGFERAAPGDPLAAVALHHREVARAADHDLAGLEQCLRRRAERGEAVVADADHREPGLGRVALRRRRGRDHGASRISALTAAAASALPPRRPRSVT